MDAGRTRHEPTVEQFERVMSLTDSGGIPRRTALDLLRHLDRDQLAEILPAQEYLQRAVGRARRSSRDLAATTMRLREVGLEIAWYAPAYAA